MISPEMTSWPIYCTSDRMVSLEATFGKGKQSSTTLIIWPGSREWRARIGIVMQKLRGPRSDLRGTFTHANTRDYCHLFINLLQ